MPPPAPAPPASVGPPLPEADCPESPLPAAPADPSPARPESAEPLEAPSADSPEAEVDAFSPPSPAGGPGAPLEAPDPEPASPEFDPDPDDAPAFVAFACEGEIDEGATEPACGDDPPRASPEAPAAPVLDAAPEDSPADPDSPWPREPLAFSQPEPSDPSPSPPPLPPLPPSLDEPSGDPDPPPCDDRSFAATDELDEADAFADTFDGVGSTGSVGCAGSAGLAEPEAERSIFARSMRAATIGSSGFSSTGRGSLAHPTAISVVATIAFQRIARRSRAFEDPLAITRGSCEGDAKFPIEP